MPGSQPTGSKVLMATRKDMCFDWILCLRKGLELCIYLVSMDNFASNSWKREYIVHLWIPCLASLLDRVNIVHLSVKIEVFIILFSTTVLETDTIRWYLAPRLRNSWGEESGRGDSEYGYARGAYLDSCIVFSESTLLCLDNKRLVDHTTSLCRLS